MARILVVDDDPDILFLADKVLRDAGHTVFVAEDAIRAADWLNHVEFDLLLSDANMPHYSGFELVTTVRNDTKYDRMAVAMLTGLRERKDVERAVKMGVDDYIVKPVDPLLLVQKVNTLFEKRPPLIYPEIRLIGEETSASVDSPITVESISELGVKVVAGFAMQPGTVIDIRAEFFRQLGEPPPPLKVLSADSEAKNGKFGAQLMFIGARESFLKKVRRLIVSRASQMTRTQ